jgi:probable F420-dependent oxidoreductase
LAVVALGVNIPNFGPTATPATLRGWVRFAEDHGFDLAMMSDHVAPTSDVAALYPPPFYDPFTTLAWLAGLTTHVRLGISVAILPYRHPLLTARLSATIDRFTDGRFVLGIGVGWSEREYRALGMAFRERGRITDEYLAAILDAWTHDTVTHEGTAATYHDVSTAPRPVATPHPPVWVGGAGPPAIRRAARFGDAWHPVNPSLAWLRATGLPALRHAAADHDRPTPAFAPRIRARPTERELPRTDRPIGTGGLPQIRADIEALVELGATHVILDTNPDDPADRRPAHEDWRTLAAIADAVAGASAP